MIQVQPRSEEIPEEYMGPAMLALSTDKMRRFAVLMGCGELNASTAASRAGYSDNGVAVVAHRLKHRPDVQAAIREVAERVFENCMPLAIASAQAILRDDKHPAHARMIETMLDRTGFGAKSEHKVTVEHRDLTGPAMLARINELAEKFGIGAGKLPLIEQVVQEEVPRETGTVGESDPAGGAASAGGAGA